MKMICLTPAGKFWLGYSLVLALAVAWWVCQ